MMGSAVAEEADEEEVDGGQEDVGQHAMTQWSTVGKELWQVKLWSHNGLSGLYGPQQEQMYRSSST